MKTQLIAFFFAFVCVVMADYPLQNPTPIQDEAMRNHLAKEGIRQYRMRHPELQYQLTLKSIDVALETYTGGDIKYLELTVTNNTNYLASNSNCTAQPKPTDSTLPLKFKLTSFPITGEYIWEFY